VVNDEPSSASAAQTRPELGCLADALIARHLRISVPDSAVRDRLSEVPDAPLYPAAEIERRTRCIAVVGAGASEPLMSRANDLATELEKHFERDEAALERLELVSGFSRKDFETRLIALSTGGPEVERKVREAISEKYDVRHPTLLCYELLAHLLKHRFLDAIISFNFDELLDQSLDDELDAAEYVTVISERDCTDLQADAGAPNYVPLYVKLHGTANEPESLRFTPESYYSLPPRLVSVARELLHAEQCVILNMGAGLGSFDLQRLLAIPDRLDVFDLSAERLALGVIQAIDSEREADGAGSSWLHDCSSQEHKCEGLLQQLTARIQEKCGVATGESPAPESPSELSELVQFRSVIRHEAVATLLGTNTVHTRWMTTPEWSRYESIEYARRRTILELAFAGAKARGLLSLVPLALDRPSRYYDRYRTLTEGRGESWSALCSAAGLVESESIPDILESNRSLRKDPTWDDSRGKSTHALHEFAPGKLARHVLARVKNPYSDKDLKLLKRTIKDLQRESDVEIHTKDDRVCSKAFRRPAILATATSLRAYTWLMLKGLSPDDEVHVSSETGAWLLKEPIFALLSEQRKIRALLAFDIEEDLLEKAYGERLERRVVDPWRHNRHMTIVCQGEQPVRALYFARRLRTPIITPVYLDGPRDVQRLMKMYTERWDEAPHPV
jgi:hypothetical protein